MTKLQSLIRDKNKLVPIEIELTLWPGLPGIQFLGLPDQHIKESTLRIKSAIKYSGYQFPQAQQILVNLRPSHLRKTSKGLDLAVACAYLLESGQIDPSLELDDLCVYGELTLQGEVLQPDDILDLPVGVKSILTGSNRQAEPAHVQRRVINSLLDLANLDQGIAHVGAEEHFLKPQRPMGPIQQKYSKDQARLISILAVGEHSALLAGAAGSGKTTLAKAVSAFLQEPQGADFFNLKKIHREFGADLQWRPVVKPHHSTPVMAMIGGGSVPFAGEISRAHGGILILDELLEFSGTVQESLREPFEEGKMRVFRSGKLAEYPAYAQIIASTNLCPCGDWTPQMKNPSCRFSMIKCQSYSSRLSGPLVDRFDILFFHHQIGALEVVGEEIFLMVEKAQIFSKFWKKDIGFVDNWQQRINGELLIPYLDQASLQIYNSETFSSQRRKSAVIRVARTLADLDLSLKIQTHHLREAMGLCRDSFERIKRWG